MPVGGAKGLPGVVHPIGSHHLGGVLVAATPQTAAIVLKDGAAEVEGAIDDGVGGGRQESSATANGHTGGVGKQVAGEVWRHGNSVRHGSLLVGGQRIGKHPLQLVHGRCRIGLGGIPTGAVVGAVQHFYAHTRRQAEAGTGRAGHINCVGRHIVFNDQRAAILGQPQRQGVGIFQGKGKTEVASF